MLPTALCRVSRAQGEVHKTVTLRPSVLVVLFLLPLCAIQARSHPPWRRALSISLHRIRGGRAATTSSATDHSWQQPMSTKYDGGVGGLTVIDEVQGGEDAVVELATALINIESVSGREQRMATALKGWLEARGWEVKLQPVEKVDEASSVRWNVYAYRPEASLTSAGPRLLFNTHIDTVPPFYPATVDLSEGVIRGRGACDTKSIIAAQLFAAQRLVSSGLTDVGLLFVVSEETDHSGMKKANELGLKPKFLVVGEPTESKMIRAQKGILKCKLTSKGVSCHSGYPHLGKSAIDPLVDVVHELAHGDWPKSQELGDTTLNVGLISGGHAANALASHAEATLMFRVITPPEEILEAVKGVAKNRVAVDIITANSPVKLGVVEGYEQAVVAFNTDIPYFRLEEGATPYLIGPGSILDAHSDHEKIFISELKNAVDIYVGLATKLLRQ